MTIILRKCRTLESGQSVCVCVCVCVLLCKSDLLIWFENSARDAVLFFLFFFIKLGFCGVSNLVRT